MARLMFSPDEVFRLVDQELGGPFRWGVQDCLLGCANVFLGLTGIDLAQDVRGTYGSLEEAEKVLGGFGGSLSIYMKVKCSHFELEHRERGEGSPVGSIGISPPGISLGLDGRCIGIKIKDGLWATKALRGFTFLTEVERSWNA